MSENDRQDLIKALKKSLELVESTVSWAEARGFTDSQEYLDWEDELNKLSTKDHKINFHKFKYMD